MGEGKARKERQGKEREKKYSTQNAVHHKVPLKEHTSAHPNTFSYAPFPPAQKTLYQLNPSQKKIHIRINT